MYAPAKTQAASMQRLSDALRKALSSQDVIDALGHMGLEAKASTSAELAALLKRDSDRWAPLIKTIGFTADSSRHSHD